MNRPPPTIFLPTETELDQNSLQQRASRSPEVGPHLSQAPRNGGSCSQRSPFSASGRYELDFSHKAGNTGSSWPFTLTKIRPVTALGTRVPSARSWASLGRSSAGVHRGSQGRQVGIPARRTDRREGKALMAQVYVLKLPTALSPPPGKEPLALGQKEPRPEDPSPTWS